MGLRYNQQLLCRGFESRSLSFIYERGSGRAGELRIGMTVVLPYATSAWRGDSPGDQCEPAIFIEPESIRCVGYIKLPTNLHCHRDYVG